jgi:hypothetical protein
MTSHSDGWMKNRVVSILGAATFTASVEKSEPRNGF